MSTLSVHDLQGIAAYSNIVRVPSGSTLSVEGKFKLPSYTSGLKPTGVAGEMIYVSDTQTVEIWSGSAWIIIGGGVGLTADAPATGGAQIQAAGITTNGLYWIKPTGYIGDPVQVYVDFNGSQSGITDVTGPWVRVRYAQDYYTRSSPWTNTGRSDPSSEAGTAYSGSFDYEQPYAWIDALIGNATEVRQRFESWGYGSVGWTYQGTNAYNEARGFDNKNYTRWGGNGGTHVGASGVGRVSGMSHSVTSISGPWDNPTANLTDPTDNNDGVWRGSAFFFRYTGSSANKPLPIRGMYNADVDSAGEQRYFPFRSGEFVSGVNSDIWIKV